MYDGGGEIKSMALKTPTPPKAEPGPLSPDGQWQWSGASWVPAADASGIPPSPSPSPTKDPTARGFMAQVPGFRSNTGWKKVLSVLGYIVIAVWIVQIFGHPALGIFGLLTLGLVFLVTNGRGVRDRIPGFKSTNKFIAAGAWAGLTAALLVVGVLAAPSGSGAPAASPSPSTAQSGSSTSLSPKPDPSASAQAAADKAAADKVAADKAAADKAAADKAAADKAVADKAAADKAAADKAAADKAAAAAAAAAAAVPRLTSQQQNAARSAQQYLSISGFSRQGLIDQLSSSAGDGYSVQDATVAVGSLTVDWNAEAVRSAKAYLSISPFSCNGLIQQLNSSAGDKYTLAQATYGAQHAGAC